MPFGSGEPRADKARAAPLRNESLLDRPRDEAVDRLTRLAAHALRAPTALLTAVDERRQFFLSSYGLAEPWAAQRETPLSHSFCQYVVRHAAPLAIPDARADPLVRDSLAIRDLGIVAYLGVPLVDDVGEAGGEGAPVGSFAVIDRQPREWSDEEIALLRDFAATAVTELQLAAAVRREHELVEQLQAERSRFEAVVRQMPSGVLIAEAPSGRPLFGNAQLEVLLRFSVTGDDWAERFARVEGYRTDGQRLAPPEWPLARAVMHGEMTAGEELTVVRGDGTPAMVRMSAGPIRDASGVVIAGVAVFEDVTRQRSLEAQLLQSQKLEAVGQLAGGVAHDFNNLLTAIFGHLDIILVDLPADSPIRDDVVEVRRAAERAARLTRQLLSFSRKQILQPRAVAINAVIGEAEQMLRRVIGETVEVRVQLASDAGNVLVDPLQIGQILLNLVLNARDAMPSGGVVEISTANATITADEPARAPGIIPGEYVTITVRDNGTGIDPDTLAHIFEPFFTTKGVGKGTGLGLATVYGIVRQSRGFVGVESAPNEGSAFTVYLPRIDSAASREEAPAPSVVRPRGSETILLAEDDPTVRAALRRALEQSGYRVLEAQHGADALRVYAAHGDAIDLVITDAVMPELGGLELRRRLHAERPTLPVLVVSGYSDVRATEREDIGESFLAKPFDSETLLARLRQLLARVRTQIGEVGGAGA